MSRSGTSASAPLTAGVVCQYLQTHPTATPAEVSAFIVSTSTKNAIHVGTGNFDMHDTPNRILFTNQ